MLSPDTPLISSIVFYIIINVIVLIFRPNFIYCYKSNKFKSFGFEDNETIMPIHMFSIFIAFLLYMFFTGIHIFFR